ncbi:MAG: S8 family serine peptidase, partial [Thermoanaerobaculia bacterium]
MTDFENTQPPGPGSLSSGKKIVGYWVLPGATAYDNDATCNDSSTSFHGTHTSATVAGDDFAQRATSSFAGVEAGDGMAPGAQILFQDIGNDQTGCLQTPDDAGMLYLQALSGGARVHSNSYGNEGGDGTYATDDRSADQFLFDHEEMAIFFAAGNGGPGPSTTSTPGNAKNVISVGALGHGNDTTAADFSSRGPTADGRVKPDIMAPGVNAVSALGDASHTTNNCATQNLSGTSMSCPTVAGAAALLRQYFADGFYPTGVATASNRFDPPAPLVKAVLLNGTLPLGVFGASADGWGRVFLDNNLFFSGDARALRVWSVANTQGLTTGQSSSYTVNVAAGQELRATLVWFDPEGTPGAGLALVNNLDLSVSGGSLAYLGNVFDGAGVSVTGGAADTRNTVEQVRLTAPAAGTYMITVTAAGVPGNGRPYTNRQGYALVVSAAGCATAVGAAPAGLSVASNPVMGADLSLTAAPGSRATQIYRAGGDCAAGIEKFQYISSTAGATFTDTRAQGGLTYSYRVRGVDNCGEGPASACVSLTPAGHCDLLPTFSGLAAASAQGTSCQVHLTWAAASAHCTAGLAVSYNVYRSTVSNFAPSLSTLLANVSGLSFDDNAVVSGTTYYYVVRAEDTNPGGAGPHGGNEDGNAVVAFANAAGPPGSAVGTWSDDGGDTSALLRAEAPWQVSAREKQAGTRSYHSGPEQGTYPPNICGSLTTPDLPLATGSVLTYLARYNIEFQWDGVIVEISSDGGATWTGLPPAAGYGSSLSQTQGNGCNDPATQ